MAVKCNPANLPPLFFSTVCNREAEDLAQEEVLQSLDHMLREETLKVLDVQYWTFVTLTANPVVFLLNQLDLMYCGKNCFFQERENSQDSTMAVSEKLRDYPWEGQRVLDSHILNVIKFLNDRRKLSEGCCTQDNHWF